MTDLIGAINLASGIIQIMMGIFVLFSGIRNKVKKYYFVSVLFLGLWSLSIFFYSNPAILPTTIWLKIVYTMAYCMTLGLILFARVYPKELKEKFRTFSYMIGIYMLIMVVIMWSTDWVVVSTLNFSSQFNTIAKMGPLYVLYGIPEFVTAIYVVGYYLKQVKVLTGIEKKQIQYYVTGGILMLIPVIVFDFLLPLIFKDTSYYKFGTIGNAVWTMIVGYSILTTRFLDLRVVVGTILGVIMKTLFVGLSLCLILFVLVPYWDIDFSSGGFVKVILISMTLAYILEKLFAFVQNLLIERFVYVRYHPNKTLRSLINKNMETVEFQEISENLLKLIMDSLKPGFVSILMFDSKKRLLVDKSKGTGSVDVKNILETLEVWRKLNSNRILVYSELKSDKRAGKSIIDRKRDSILQFMQENSIEVIFSLKESDKFNGVIIIGQNYERDAYTVGDIDFLDSIVQNTHMSFARAYLYLELQAFNQTLQEKVNEQTQELQIKVQQLQEARKKERDMIDIMGHELRTPATIVKLNVELLEKYIDNNPEDFKKYVDRIKGAIENEIKLINTLLSSAKLEGNKIEIKKERVDIQAEIDMAVHGYEGIALGKEMRIINNTDPNLPDVYSDKARTVEILNNLVDNAIKYTEKGSVTIETEHDDEFVKVSVIDTGKGIPQDEIPKLGEKFHRINNYLESNKSLDIVRPGGTGLGLYVTFRLVELMGGKIWVESEMGVGSKFIFTLPVFNGQTDEGKSTESKDMFERLGLHR